MHIVRGRTDTGFGIFRLHPDGSAAAMADAGTISELLRLPVDQIRERYAAAGTGPTTSLLAQASIIDGRMEVWAAGVTYQRSRSARAEESASADVYERVYDATRPELFFKSVAWRVVMDDDAIGVRADSPVNVPEPELAIVANAYGEIVGYTVCNDVSSRTIEGENPLYLPQAKVYERACAVSAAIRPAWEIADPYGLSIDMAVVRDGSPVWSGTSSTALLHRRLPELVEYAFRSQPFPDGMVLSTGTPLVPDLTFNLTAGDVVDITIQDVGRLRNPVVEIGRNRAGT